ncbi:MAG TPA: glycosyltransferase family 4 protein [Nitrososphaerales archaeon]|nr:glycosyltransferase family 4 protein [Nitrososphaerales archaeon]
MKIAVVTETFTPFMGGSSRRYHEVFKRLAKDHDVHLFTPKLSPSWPEEEVIDGIKVHRSEGSQGLITTDGLRSVRGVLRFCAWSFRRLEREGPFDVVEANHCPIFPALSSWLRTRMSRTPLSVTFHEVWYSEWYRYVPRSVYAPVGIRLEHATTLVPDLAIAVSETTAQGLRDCFHLPREKTKVISNGVDTEMFDGGASPERDRRGVVFVGRLNPHKRLDLLLGAVGELAPSYDGVRLRVVGDGPWAGNYKAMAASDLLKGKVSFLGALDDHDVAQELKRARVYVQSSIREGQSITVLEAMAAGTPQVAVKAPGSAVPALLDASKSGLAVEASAGGIAKAIGRLFDDGALWDQLSTASLDYARRYSWDNIAREHERAYVELADGRRR